MNLEDRIKNCLLKLIAKKDEVLNELNDTHILNNLYTNRVPSYSWTDIRSLYHELDLLLVEINKLQQYYKNVCEAKQFIDAKSDEMLKDRKRFKESK